MSRKARELTKEMLEKVGITYVSENGLHIIKKGKECKQNEQPIKFVNKYSIKPNYYLSISAGPLGVIAVHRIVYAWWVGKIPAGMEIDHIDGITWNNNIKNLRCVTHEENMKNRHEWDKNNWECLYYQEEK